MEERVARITSGVALLVEAGSALLIAIGSIEAIFGTFASYFQPFSWRRTSYAPQ
jgi:hypothetical protein